MSPLFWPFWRQKDPALHQQRVPLKHHAHDNHNHQQNTTATARTVGFAAPSSPSPIARPSSPSGGPENFDLKDAPIEIAGSSAVSAAATVHRDPSSAPEHRRFDGSASLISSTTPNAFEQPSALDKPPASRIKTYAQQSEYPVASLDPAADPTATAAKDHRPTARRYHNNTLTQSPFRSFRKANPPTSYRGRASAASRLWNPTNSTPRIPEQRRLRKRRPSTPPLPTLPLQYLALGDPAELHDPVATSAGSYPLLTLSEQRRSRHSASTRASFQFDWTGASDCRISLPRSIRVSHDGQQSVRRTSIAVDPGETIPDHDSQGDGGDTVEPSAKSKGKQKATTMATPGAEVRTSYSRDLERGPDILAPRMSNVSAADGIGSALSSSDSSIMGEDVQPDTGEEWGPQHPCYPHLNPHVPIESLEYATTRIIRVKRDWLVAGDLAPTFSNLYPEILDPAGVSEQEFRRVLEKLNGELIPIFDPFGFRNMLDSVLGLVTGWLWDDFSLTAAKSRLNNLEKWIERWNQEMEKTMSSDEGVVPPKLISLRQTGYLSLDIQIPDPEIAPAPSTIGAGESRTALPMEPMPAITA